MKKLLHLLILTPNKIAFNKNIYSIFVSTIDGEVGILPEHAPITLALTISPIRIKLMEDSFSVEWMAINGGILNLFNNKVTIITESAEMEKDIDIHQAYEDKKIAENQIKEAKKTKNMYALKVGRMSLYQAINRIKVSTRTKD